MIVKTSCSMPIAESTAQQSTAEAIVAVGFGEFGQFSAVATDSQLQRAYDAYLRTQHANSALLAHDNPTYRAIREVLDTTARALGVETESLRFDIQCSPRSNAYVFRESEPKHIIVTTGLLEAIQARYGEVRTGHLVMILGHELGHIIEGGYNSANRDDWLRHEPIPMRLSREAKQIADGEERLLALSFGRDQEYRCDETGLRAIKSLGLDPNEGIQVLEVFVAAASNEPRNILPQQIQDNFLEYAWIIDKVTASHPAPPSRVQRARGLLRQFEIEERRDASTSYDQNTKPNSSPCIELINLGPSSLSLFVQSASRQLSTCVTNEESAAVAESLLTNADSTEKLLHLLFLTCTGIFARDKLPGLVPFEHQPLPPPPQGSEWVRSSPNEVKSQTTQEREQERLIEDKRLARTSRYMALAELVAPVLDALGTQTTSENLEPRETSLVRMYMLNSLVFSFQSTSPLIDLLNQSDPIEVLRAITKVGCVHLNGEYVHDAWLATLPAGSAACERAQLLCTTETFDLREALFQELVSDRIQEALKTRDLDFAAECLHALVDLFEASPDTADALVYNISESLNLNSPDKHQLLSGVEIRKLREIGDALRSRGGPDSAAHALAHEYETWVIGNARTSFDELVRSIGENYERGATRDLMLLAAASRDEKIRNIEDFAKLIDFSWTRLESPAFPSRGGEYNMELERASYTIDLRTLPVLHGAFDRRLFASVLTIEGGYIAPSTRDDHQHRLARSLYLEAGRSQPEEIFPSSNWGSVCIAAGNPKGQYIENLDPKAHDSAPGLECFGEARGFSQLQELLSLPSGHTRDLMLIANLYRDIHKPIVERECRNKDLSAEQRSILASLRLHFVQGAPVSDEVVPRELVRKILADLRLQTSRPWDEEHSKEKDLPAKIDSAPPTAQSRSVYTRPASIEVVLNALAQIRTENREQVSQLGDRTNGINLIETARQVRLLFEDYSLFTKHRMGVPISGNATDAVQDISEFIRPFDVPELATRYARAAFAYFYDHGKASAYQHLDADSKVDLIRRLFIFESSERDRHLVTILDSIKVDPSNYNLRETIYGLLGSPIHKLELGRNLYAETLALQPEVRQCLARRLDAIIHYHPEGTSSRQRALRAIVDGEAGEPALIRSWEDYELLSQRLQMSADSTANNIEILRSASLSLFKDFTSDSSISAQERVRTVLWLVGLVDKSHLAECLEIASGKERSSFKSEIKKLTDDEKRGVLEAILAGPKGILRETGLARKDFLDALFSSVFNNAESNSSDRRKFKAVFDCMVLSSEPERASEFLSRFLSAHLEGRSFAEQAKLFFESFGFVGIKSAQYLVSNTNLLSKELRESLMDLTSRVEGPDKRFVFDLAHRQFGEDAKKIIRNIGDSIGGGSLMSFYEVDFWNPECTATGRTGVLGVLRPDIVSLLPEDLRLLRSVIETMSAAPELFDGATVSNDMIETVAWQSVVETDIQRTARLQDLARKDIEIINGLLSSPGIYSVPEVYMSHEIREGASTRQIQITGGFFIAMERAQGITLDRYAELCSTQDSIGQEKLKLIYQSIAELLTQQILQGRVVHCDLHPGNILVSEDADGNPRVTLIDWGLATELDPQARDTLRHVLRVSLGAQGQTGGVLRHLMRSLGGTGEVSADEAQAWFSELVSLVEVLRQSPVEQEARKILIDEIYSTAVDTTKDLKDKLEAVSSACQRAQVELPDSLYYLLRGFGVTDYVWSHVDTKDFGKYLGKSLSRAQTEKNLPKLDVSRSIQVLADISAHCDWQLDLSKAKQVLVAANRKRTIGARMETLMSGFRDTFGESDSKSLRKFVHELHQSVELRRALGIEIFWNSLAQTLQETPRRAILQKIFGDDNTNLAEIARRSYQERIGSSGTVWKRPVQSGTLVRARNPGNRAELPADYIVLPPADPFNPEALRLGKLTSNSAAYGKNDPSAFLEKKMSGRPKPENAERRYSILMSLLHGDYHEICDVETLLRGGHEVRLCIAGEWYALEDLKLCKGESASEFMNFASRRRAEMGLDPQTSNVFA